MQQIYRFEQLDIGGFRDINICNSVARVVDSVFRGYSEVRCCAVAYVLDYGEDELYLLSISSSQSERIPAILVLDGAQLSKFEA